MPIMQSRRTFLSTLTAGATAAAFGARPSLSAEEPPETAAVRLAKLPAVCLAPQYVAEELLSAEGFKDIRYLDADPAQIGKAIGRGEVDFSAAAPLDFLEAIDAGASIVVLGGVHVGCYEFFAREGIRNITELKGKTIGLNASPSALLILMAAQVGLDPRKTSIGSRRPIPRRTRSSPSCRGRSMGFSASRRSRRRSDRTTSAG
jgi:NitT/TauT family transport system substrate-binding protein